MFSSSKMSELKQSANDIDEFACIPFLKADIPLLKAELASVSAACEDVSPSVDSVNWWKVHGAEFPHWFEAFKQMILV